MGEDAQWLVVRTDTDGHSFWDEYTFYEHNKMMRDVNAHVLTEGVARLEIIVSHPHPQRD